MSKATKKFIGRFFFGFFFSIIIVISSIGVILSLAYIAKTYGTIGLLIIFVIIGSILAGLVTAIAGTEE